MQKLWKKQGIGFGIYSNKNWLETKLDYKTLESKYTIWVAQYSTKCTYSGKYDIWQNSASGKVNGVNGDCDTNIMYRDLITDISKYPASKGSNSETNGNNNDVNNIEYLKISGYNGTSIVDALQKIGVDTSLDYRKKLAEKNGIKNYSGTTNQNLQLLNLLKQGKLAKA